MREMNEEELAEVMAGRVPGAYLAEAAANAMKAKVEADQRAREDVGADDCQERVWDGAAGMAGDWGWCKHVMSRSDRCRKHGGKG